MATVTLTIPDQHVTRVVHALCKKYGYEETPANAKQAVIEEIKRVVFDIEYQESLETVQSNSQPTDGIVE